MNKHLTYGRMAEPERARVRPVLGAALWERREPLRGAAAQWPLTERGAAARVEGPGVFATRSGVCPVLSAMRLQCTCFFGCCIFVLLSVCSGGGMVECTDRVPPLGWLVGWLDGWLLVGWLIGGLIGWLVGCLDGWFVDWLEGFLVGWSVGWLVGWLAGW